MKPFLLIAVRPEDSVAAQEYEAVRRFGGLNEAELVHMRLDQTPMPQLNFSDYSGLIIGGSPFNVSDDADAKSDTQKRVEGELDALLAEVISQDFPLLGLCYGLGVLGTHLGAEINHNFGEQAGAVEIQLTDAGKGDPLLQGIPHQFHTLTGHKEAIANLPATASNVMPNIITHTVSTKANQSIPVTLLASSITAPVQMIRVGKNVYAVQFHPELDVPGILERLSVYSNNGYFQPGEFEATVAKINAHPVNHAHQIIKNFVAHYEE